MRKMYTKQIKAAVRGSGRGAWYHGQGVGRYVPGTKGEAPWAKEFG